MKITKVSPSVVVTPEYQITGGSTKRYTLGKWLEIEVAFDTAPEDIDELSFHYSIMVNRKLLDGDVTLVDIMKGRDHYSVMYISPHAIAKLLQGRPLTNADVQNVWVQISHQGQTLDQAAVRPAPQPNVEHVTGMVLNKMQTPFAPLYWDRYEAIKPDTH